MAPSPPGPLPRIPLLPPLLIGLAGAVTARSLNLGRRQGALSCVSDEEVYIASPSHRHLEDRLGSVGLHWDRLGWQQWKISDAGGGRVFLTSHFGQQLEDREGVLGLHDDRLGWQMWWISDAGDGQVYITSHRGGRLEEYAEGRVDLQYDKKLLGESRQKWEITTEDHALACDVAGSTPEQQQGPAPEQQQGQLAPEQQRRSAPEQKGLVDIPVHVGDSNTLRHFLLYVPTSGATKASVPLWLLAPGSGGSASRMVEIADYIAAAENHSFAFAALEGDSFLLSVSAHGQPEPGRPDDVAYARVVVEEAERRANIDGNRVFCTGYSRGARFCSRLASELSNKIAAVGLVDGVRYPEPNNATRPVPVLAFHGLLDMVNPFLGHGPYYWEDSVPETIQKWVAFNGCQRMVPRQLGPHVSLEMHVDCSAEASVWLVTISDGGHTWPGSSHNPGGLGPTDFEVNADLLMHEFFARREPGSRGWALEHPTVAPAGALAATPPAAAEGSSGSGSDLLGFMSLSGGQGERTASSRRRRRRQHVVALPQAF